MPVRDMEAFLGSGPAGIRCLGNRGANGIDGLVSTALGMAAVSRAPVVAVVGDVSFLHDLNALVAAARLGVSATIVLVDNDGGGIFSFLPQADADEPGVGLPTHFEELFGTPHGTEFGPLVRALGAGHEVVASRRRGWGRGRLAGPAGRAGPGGAHRAASQRRAAPGAAGRGGRGREPGARRPSGWPRQSGWTTAMTRVALDGAELEVEATGRGPAVLALHGFTGTARTWAPLAAALRDQRRVIAPDLLGHGRSAAPADPARYALERQADDLAALLAALDAVPADVVGYSMGARLALVLALRHPSVVRGLILESPSAGIADADRTSQAPRRRRGARRAARARRPGARSSRPGKRSRSSPASRPCPTTCGLACAPSASRHDPRGLAASLRGAGQGVMAPLHDRLAAIGCPTLVIAGALDPVGLERAATGRRGPARPRGSRSSPAPGTRRTSSSPRPSSDWPASAWP